MVAITDYLASKLREFTPEKWDSFVRWLDNRFRVLEEKADITDRVADSILARGLQVIEDGIGPSIVQAEQAAANVAAMADLGVVFFATSATSMAINTNQKTITIPESNRAQFAPAAYVLVNHVGDLENAFVGRRVSYDRQTGVLVLAVESVFGSGTFDEWEISPIATTADLEALRDQIAADRAAVQLLRNEATTAAGNASGSATAASNAQTGAANALSAFQAIWYGARDTDPAGAALGSQYLDTSQTPNVVKVLTESGWAPTVTVSIGGSRQQVYTAAEGQTGPFTVDGGFSNGSVNVNGVEFFDGNGVDLDPVAGTFTFASPRSADDLVVFRGYLANDAVDIYTKAEANALLADKADKATAVLVDEVQAFTADQKGQAIANIGGSVLAGFRDKLINGDGQISQGVYTTVADDTYWCDMHYVLTQTAAITPTVITDVADGLPSMMRLTQSQATAQRMGNAQIVEASVSKALRGKKVTLGGKLRCSAAQPIRFVILEWTGTADAVTSDVVASWTNGTFTAGNFFLGTNVTVAAVGAITPAPNTVTDWSLVADISSGCNNLIVLYWTEGTAAQNVTLDMVWGLVEGDASAEKWPYAARYPQKELALCQRYFYREVTDRYMFTRGTNTPATAVGHQIVFPVTMRATPTVVLGTATAMGSVTLQTATKETVMVLGIANSAATGSFAGYSADARL